MKESLDKARVIIDDSGFFASEQSTANSITPFIAHKHANQDQAWRKHRLSATMHCNTRIRTRLKRLAIKRDIDKMRLALIKNNSDCFMREVYEDSIVGVVKYQNVWTRAVLNRNLGVVVTVGV